MAALDSDAQATRRALNITPEMIVLAEDADRLIAEGCVKQILRFIGQDPTREGLLQTPARVVRAWSEMTAGYYQKPEEILGTTFGESCDEIIVVRDIEFYSTCEHHMLPFHGRAAVGYLPGERVVGLSKIARLVDCFARRLQIQERMTSEIADAMEEHLLAKGVGVVIRASHMCMAARGVRKPTADMTTSAMRGAFRTEASARAEFMRLIA